MEIGLAVGTEAGACRSQPGSLEALCRVGSAFSERRPRFCVTGPPWPEAGGAAGCPERGPRSWGRRGVSWRAGISC